MKELELLKDVNLVFTGIGIKCGVSIIIRTKGLKYIPCLGRKEKVNLRQGCNIF